MDGIETKQLGVMDWIFFSLLLVVSLGIGIYSALKGRGNSTTQEFLLGGRQMSPVPVAISLLGGVISAISILGLATEMYYYGTQLCLNLVGCFFGTFVVQYLFLPILYPLEIVSLNEYIKLRFGSTRFRKMATLSSVLSAFIYMGLCLYAPSLTLSTVTSLSTFSSIVIMGSICTFYITIGGVKAVVYTDVVQTLLMFGGVLAVVIMCCTDLGGVSNVFTIANEGERIQFFNMNTSPLERHTFWSVQLQGFFAMVCWVGLNQSTYQRFASVSTLTTSKRLCTFFLFGLYALWLTFYFSGIVAYAVYKDCDPLTSERIEKPDQILPYLVLDKLSHLTGLAGIFVAAVYGGVLSSLSSTGNSLACVLWEDILKDLKIFKGITDVNATKVIKLLSAVSGIVGIGLGMLAGQLGNIFQVSTSIGNAISGSLSGSFIAGMCAPWVNRKGAITGFVSAFLFNAWLVIGQFMKNIASPEKLPLSVEGCPENLLYNSTFSALVNSSTEVSFSGLLESTVSAENTFDSFNDTLVITLLPGLSAEGDEQREKNIYDISYCYTGILGVVVNLIISTIISIITGPVHPSDVDERLVSVKCLRFYKFIWRMLKLSDGDDNLMDKRANIPMVTITKAEDLNKPE